VKETDGGKLTIRAITFQNGQASNGGGGLLINAAAVDVQLCVFINCESTSTYYGGGGIYASGATTSLNVYGTSFSENEVPAATDSSDIYTSTSSITVHNTCPVPYSAVAAVEGK
jgi:hypothetical protein